MKLRNKANPNKLGEIVPYDNAGKCGIAIKTDESVVWYYHSLDELNEEWEDYKEPFSTQFYTIVDGEIKRCIFYSERIAGCPSDAWAYLKEDGREKIKQLKEVGLYFETLEEAEKAVEKLKAVKRLKDKGFRFERWLLGGEYGNTITFSDYIEYDDETRADLNLLFGGEE